MIRRYIIWRNNHAADKRLKAIVTGRTLPDPLRQAASQQMQEAPHVVIAVEARPSTSVGSASARAASDSASARASPLRRPKRRAVCPRHRPASPSSGLPGTARVPTCTHQNSTKSASSSFNASRPGLPPPRTLRSGREEPVPTFRPQPREAAQRVLEAQMRMHPARLRGMHSRGACRRPHLTRRGERCLMRH